MKILKPGSLAVLTRPFEHGRRFYMGVSVMSFIPLGRVDTMLHEVAMWKFVAKRLGQDALDVGIPKSRGEFLVNGSAYAPGGIPHPQFPVRATVGPLQKSLYVFGDRYWTGRSATEARPFTEMPLDWAHAYGGAQYPKNPGGKGHAEIEIQGERIQPLPNIETPHQLVGSPNDRPAPASLGPVDISWPQRNALAGTHDQDWLENLFPGFARDVDWGIHNIAPTDQQREGFWPGGERYQFDNLHPSKPTLTGELPQFRARVFVSRSHRAGQPRLSHAETKAALRVAPTQIEEVPLALQTLWFFPDAEVAVLIWQGSTFVVEEDGADLLHLLAAAEHRERPRSSDHYFGVLGERLDPKFGVLAMLRDEDLLPEDLANAPTPMDAERELVATENLASQAHHRRMTVEVDKARAIIASYGLDPDKHGPAKVGPMAPPPTMQEIPAFIEKANADAAALRAEAEAKRDVALAEVEQIIDDAKIEGFTKETLHEEINGTQVGPPTWTAAAQRADLQRIAMHCRSQGTIADELEDILADPAVYALWEGGEQKMRDGYRMSAHFQTPAPPMPEELREATRERVRMAVANHEDFATLNLTGADLSNMQLAGADLSNAFLESAKLDDADLSGANLSNAVLAHASLLRTRLADANLNKANLGKAKLDKTILDGADLREATLSDAQFDDASMVGSKLETATLLGARLTRVNARALEGERLTFLKVTIDACDFSGAKLEQSVLLHNDLRGSIFDGAQLRSCTFVDCKAQAVSFIGASLDNARFVEDTKLDDGVFSEASLVGANLRGSSLQRANFRKATLDGADLCECNLAEAKFYQCSARGTKFEAADLRDADLTSGNFMHASFARARIYGADLRGANLHGADMARVRSDARVQLDQALLTKVRIHPRHVEQVGQVEQGEQP